MRDLKERVAVVTGAANGIGRTLSQAFAAMGYELALVDLDAERLEHSPERFALSPQGFRLLSQRVQIGRETVLIDWAKRLFPKRTQRLIADVYSRGKLRN